MSSRQLRKLQQRRELEQAAQREQRVAEASGSEDDDQEEDFVAPIKKASLFANLAALQDQEDEDEENEQEFQHQSDADNGPAEPTVAVTKPGASKKKKKKKAKNKSLAKGDTPAAQSPLVDGSDEIDAALEALRIEAGERKITTADEAPPLDPEYERVCKLLGINNHHLKVANEMRNLFGRTATDNHDDAGGPVGRGARRRQRGVQQIDLETALKGHHAPGKGLAEITLRRNIFIQGKDHWPRASTGGLTMEIVDDQASDGTVEFRFVHSQTYDAVQQQFNMFVEMGDPQNLIGLLQRNPYHISLLLQVSKIAKDQSDHSLSNDLVERALFTFARASLSSFATKLSQGKARLDFARPENRELWLAGYQYIKSLIMKGTYRTALEWAKLLLSLDPEEDPYCMKFMIHHLALRANEFHYMEELASSPIFEQWSAGMSHTQPSFALAAMHLKEGAKCREILGHCIERLPWLFCKLFQEIGLTTPPSIWGVEPRTDAENLFTELYVRQTKDLWNTPEATGLLMEVAHATQKLPEDQLVKSDNSKINLNVARFVYLDNTPALMAMVPSELMHRIPNSDSDPLPPDENIFSWDSQRNAFAPRQSQVAGAFGDHFDPIQALRRLIPGFTGTDAEADERAIEETGLREILDHRDVGDIDDEDVSTESDIPVAPQSAGVDIMNRLYGFFFGRRGQPDMQTDALDSESESADTEIHSDDEFDYEHDHVHDDGDDDSLPH